MNKKITLIVLGVGGILTSFVIGFYTIRQTAFNKQLQAEPEVLSTEEERDVYLNLDYGGGKVEPYSFEFRDGMTAFSILKDYVTEKGYNFSTQQYDFGVFVKDINNYESDNQKAWIYSVNGEAGNVAADKYELKDGDIVEWKYSDIDNSL
jgi:uncharacterized protein YaiE (UPF0345 family)